MIESLANRMAGFVVKNDDTADQEILAYGFGHILAGIATYTALLVSALFFSVFFKMLLALLVYMVMRLTIGGSHAKTRLICFTTYASTMYLCIFLASSLSLPVAAVAVLYGVDVVLLIKYAPADTAAQPIVKGRTTRKILGLVFLTLFFCISLFIFEMQAEANILLFVSTLTCLFVHPVIYKIYGCEKSELKEEKQA